LCWRSFPRNRFSAETSVPLLKGLRMYVKLNEITYGLAYRNHRYELNQYNVSLFPNKVLRDEFYDRYIIEVETECLKFQFKLEDLIKRSVAKE